MASSPITQTPTKTVNESSEGKSLSILLSAAVIALFVGVRLWRLSATCLWFDEIFSVHAARHGWIELLRFVAADLIHPPLFYLLLKIWIALGGESSLWLRLLPALLSIAAIAPFFFLCRELELKRNEQNLALLLLAVNGYLIKYAQELRMYTLLMFLSLCSLWLFIKLFRNEEEWRKQLVWLSLVNLLLVYSHYAGWLVVVLECLVLVIWQRPKAKHFLIAIAVNLITFVPWVFLVIANSDAGKGLAQNIGWVTRPTLWDLTQFYALLNKPFWFIQSTAARPFDLLTAFFSLLILGAPLLLFTILLWRSRERANELNVKSFRAFFWFVSAPVAIVFGLSWLLPQSIWGTRHLIIVIAPYAILVSLAVFRLPRNWIRITVGLIFGSWFLIAGLAWGLTPPPVYIWCAWEPLARQVVSEPQPAQEVRIYAFEDLVAYHLWFALDSAQRRQFKVTVIKSLAGVQEDPAYFLPRQFNEIEVINGAKITEDEIWIAYRAARWNETQPPLSSLENMGYKAVDVHSIQAQGQQAFMVQMRRK